MGSVSYPQLSGVEAALLEVLALHVSDELYGLELLRKAEGKLKRGSLYTVLDRMEAKGYVQSRREVNPDSEVVPRELQLPRRLFRVTGIGQAAYAAHVAAGRAYADFCDRAELQPM